MSGIRDDAQLGFQPGPVQAPGARHRAHNIVAALNDYTGNLPDLLDTLDQIILSREEAIVHEVVAFDAGEGERKLRVSKSLNRVVVKEKLGSAAFPDTPCACGFDPNLSFLTVLRARVR